MTAEQWRDVAGYVGLYQVSDAGRVRSRGALFLKPYSGNSRWKDYRSVSLCSGGLVVKYQVHRLVAAAFIPNPEGKAQVNHKDGNPSNNTVENLEWATNAENNLHAYRTLGRVAGMQGKRGALCKHSKTVRISGAFDFASTGEAAEFLGVTQSAISHAIRNSKVCRGHYVEYV